MALAAWSFFPGIFLFWPGLVALAMGQDPLDAWRLELNPGTESFPVLGYQVEL